MVGDIDRKMGQFISSSIFIGLPRTRLFFPPIFVFQSFVMESTHERTPACSLSDAASFPLPASFALINCLINYILTSFANTRIIAIIEKNITRKTYFENFLTMVSVLWVAATPGRDNHPGKNFRTTYAVCLSFDCARRRPRRGVKHHGAETRGKRMSAAAKNVEGHTPLRYEARIRA